MSVTPQLGLTKPTHGSTSWDTPLNADMDTIDATFAPATGHDHSGATGKAPKLAQANTHQSPDTDSAPTALHHTLGTGATQAAAGNHTHAAATIRGAADYDDTTAPATGQAIVWDGAKYAPATVAGGEPFGVVFTGAGDVALRGDGSIATKRL